MTRWRTVHNRRRREHGRPGRWLWRSGWIVFDELAHIDPALQAAVDKFGEALLQDPAVQTALYGKLIVRVEPDKPPQFIDLGDLYAEPAGQPPNRVA